MLGEHSFRRVGIRFRRALVGGVPVLPIVGVALVPGGAVAADNPAGLLEQGLGSLPLAVPVLAAAVAIAYAVSERRRSKAAIRARDTALAAANARLGRAELLMANETQAWVVWDHKGAEPRLEGDASFIVGGPSVRRVLALSSWLSPEAVDPVASAIGNLIQNGQGFARTVQGAKGDFYELDGQAVGAAAVLRVRDATKARAELAASNAERAAAKATLSRVLGLFDALPHPVWLRNEAGELAWVNACYAKAVDAPDANDAIRRRIELLDAQSLAEAHAASAGSGTWSATVVAVAAGDRKTFTIVEHTRDRGSAAVALDQSELLAQRAELARYIEANARLLDQLTTGVAIFDRGKRLVSHNAAYRRIWELDAAFLEQRPLDGEILDRLRARRLLPEQADFKNWKAQALAGYRELEPKEQTWHLPDGRTLRVVASPNSQGGVTYLYDDATQSYALASQVNSLTNVQGETLEALKEGVAVFGADGRMKLVNRTFCDLWGFDGEAAAQKPHIDEIVGIGEPKELGSTIWSQMRDQIVGLPEARVPIATKIVRKDGVVIECAALPLPDGATLLTFLDSSANAKVEKALLDRNEALVEAERIRNDFVKHVSYELRTPLTSIIGFTQLLAEGGAGPLNPRQHEYASVISKSSSALLAIINDILDLASIDAGALALREEDVDVADAMRAAAEGVQDRLLEHGIDLKIVATGDVGTFRADGRRVRQTLFNLLSNAIGFSNAGQSVTLTAFRRQHEVVFKISDQGRGIPPEILDRVFDRFQSYPAGSRHRGAGLGLSIVRALVELHGGRVVIDSVPGEGTTVTCFFPAAAAAEAA